MLESSDGQPDDFEFFPMVMVPMFTYAERHPTVPLVTVVDCVLGVWSDPELLSAEEGWVTAVQRVVDERLARLEAENSRPGR